MTGLASAPAFAATESTASVSPTSVCAQSGEQSSSDSEDSESDSSVPDESDPQATLEQSQVTRTDIANKKEGIGFSGTGFSPDQKATVTVVGTDGTEYSPEKKLTVDEKGQVSGTYYFSVTEDAKVPVGKYSLYLTDLKSETDSSKVTFEVVSDDSEVDDPAGNDDCETTTAPADDGDSSESASKTPSETPSDSETPSETPSETDTSKPTETETEKPSESSTPSPSKTDDDKDRARRLNPGPAKQPTGDDAKSDDEGASDDDAKADDEGSSDNDAKSDDDANAEDDDKAETPEGKAPETDEDTEDSGASEDEQSEGQSSESTGPASPGSEDKKEPAAAKQALSIDPTEISSEDFLNEGIKLGVTGAQPGEKITITVEHAQGKVDRYTMTKEADSEGKATFGVQAKVKAVLGTYNVRAQAESFDEPQGGSFTVLTNGTAVDEDGNGSDSAGSDLPRTGAEMTGLALGVGLLAVGAAAVIITRRRMNATDDPAEF